MRSHLYGALLALAVILGGVSETHAQPDVRDHRRPKAPGPDVRDHRRPAPPPIAAPREAPPAPRAEKQAARKGFVWVSGRWDWRANKWKWVAGHWERERAGKKWRPGRWDRKGDVYVYVDGAWIAGGGAPVPPVATGPTSAPPSPREERRAARKGFVWVTGRWDWRGGKWDWVAGHWERERAGKKWRAGRWDRKGDVYVYVDGEWIAADTAPIATGPTEAPPSPREERRAARKGFVWVTGRWDWRGGKWDWVAGHWERERAGKKWRAGRWDRKGDIYVYVDGEWIAADEAPVATGPTEAPPSPREERRAARAGFVWITGRWDWRGGKWEWVAGHWERERAGKRWRDGRWDRRGDTWAYVDGDWEDVNAPPPDTGRPGDRPPRRRWKLDRPVVSSYWPIKGKAGTRVVIRGRNFPADASVLWGNEQVTGARVRPEQIVFVVPRDKTTGMIGLRAGRGRPLAIGTFEVAADYDAAAELRKIEAERRRQAEAAWAERRRRFAKDRAAREAAVRQRAEEREASRERRRAARVAAINAKWQHDFLADAQTQGELTLHAQRVADLVRMREVAEISNNGKLAIRIEIAQRREDARHERRMSALKESFGR